MRSKDDVYADLERSVRGTLRWASLICELYEIVCHEADVEMGLLRAAGYSEEEIWELANRNTLKWMEENK